MEIGALDAVAVAEGRCYLYRPGISRLYLILSVAAESVEAEDCRESTILGGKQYFWRQTFGKEEIAGMESLVISEEASKARLAKIRGNECSPDFGDKENSHAAAS